MSINMFFLNILPQQVFTFNLSALHKNLFVKPKKNTQKVSSLWELTDKSPQNTIRIANKLIKSKNNPSGLFRRNELITVYNQSTNQYVCGFARGCGKAMNLYPSTVALDYDQRLHLGVKKDEKKGDFLMWKARAYEQRQFYAEQVEDPLQRNLHKIQQRQYWQNILIGIVLASGFVSELFSSLN